MISNVWNTLMPISYELDEDKKLILTVFHGDVSADELVRHTRAFINDARIDSQFSHLVDTSMTKSIGLHSDAIASISRITAAVEFLKDGKTAIVAEQDVAFALSRMYQSYSDMWKRNIEVFREMEDARRWLGLDEEPTRSSPLKSRHPTPL